MKKYYISFFLLCFLGSNLSAQTIWDNFEDTRKGTYGFINGTFIPYFENPDPTGANTSSIAANYTRNAVELFDVIVLDALMADLSDYLSGAKQMSIDVWSPVAGTVVQISLENDVLAEPANFPTGRHSAYFATTTVAMGWETLTFDFSDQPDASVANDNVNRMVLLFAPNTNTGDTYFFDNLIGPELAADPCEGIATDLDIFNDFECNQNTNFVFSHAGLNFRRVLNPDQMINTSDYVATYTRNAEEEFDIIIGLFDSNLALDASDRIEFDVWDPNAPTEVIISLQNASNDVILEMTATTSISSAWNTLTFDPSSVTAATDIAKFVILFDPGVFTNDQYYFDNFAIGNITNVNDLEAIQNFRTFPNPTSRSTTFQYDLEYASSVNLSLYDASGKLVSQIVNENQGIGAQQATWDGTDFSNGIYFYTLSIDGKVGSGKIILNK